VFDLTWQAFNQTDRIQGMARYMNQDGASAELMTLAIIFAGMVALIFVLKMVSSHNQRKREEALRKKLAKRKAAQAQPQAPVRRRPVQRLR
jgi:flagellar biosynthesis/type III secretory pathway M-ring protein FliF/YscJ